MQREDALRETCAHDILRPSAAISSCSACLALFAAVAPGALRSALMLMLMLMLIILLLLLLLLLTLALATAIPNKVQCYSRSLVRPALGSCERTAAGAQPYHRRPYAAPPSHTHSAPVLWPASAAAALSLRRYLSPPTSCIPIPPHT